MIRWLLILLVFPLSDWAQSVTPPYPAGDPYGFYHWPTPNGWKNIVGIPGGHKVYSTIFCDPTVAIPGTNIVMPTDGVSDCTPALKAAFQFCPSNQVVDLPSGNFFFYGSVLIGRWQVLRGAGSWGAGETRLNFSNNAANPPGPTFLGLGTYASDGIYSFPGNGTTNPLTYSSNIVAVTKTWWNNELALGVTAWPYTNFILDICQTNDPHLVSLTGYSGHGGLNQSNGYSLTAMSQVLVITNVATNGNSVWLYSRYPFFWTCALSNTPCAMPVHFIGAIGSGVEHVHIVTLNTNAAGSTGLINIAYGLDDWVDDVQIEGSPRDGIYLNNCVECEVVNCYLNHFIYTSSAEGYGLHPFGPNSDLLLAHNVVYGARHSGILEGGGSGCAFVDCLFIGDNNYEESPGYVTQDVSTHASHPYMNLFEGCIYHKSNRDHTHGSGSHNGEYRNLITGGITNIPPQTQPGDTNWTSPRSGAKQYTQARNCIVVEPWNTYCWDCANIIGMPAITTLFGFQHYSSAPIGSWDGREFTFAVAINAGQVTVTNAADLIVSNTFIDNANYDFVTGGVTYLSNTPPILPSSLVYDVPPAWASNALIPWPNFGPDVAVSPYFNSAWLMFQQISNGFTVPLSPTPPRWLPITNTIH